MSTTRKLCREACGEKYNVNYSIRGIIISQLCRSSSHWSVRMHCKICYIFFLEREREKEKEELYLQLQLLISNNDRRPARENAARHRRPDRNDHLYLVSGPLRRSFTGRYISRGRKRKKVPRRDSGAPLLRRLTCTDVRPTSTITMKIALTTRQRPDARARARCRLSLRRRLFVG